MEEENREKCIRLYVLIVEKNAKFHSSLMAVDRYIVESAILSEDRREGIRFTCLRLFLAPHYFVTVFSDALYHHL